eukprot:scaffold9208_cov98-Cylindrotheca_fusiformis.AAC.2
MGFPLEVQLESNCCNGPASPEDGMIWQQGYETFETFRDSDMRQGQEVVKSLMTNTLHCQRDFDETRDLHSPKHLRYCGGDSLSRNQQSVWKPLHWSPKSIVQGEINCSGPSSITMANYQTASGAPDSPAAAIAADGSPAVTPWALTLQNVEYS